MPEFKCHSVILCDDVRIEDSGKHLLIGVYTNGISVASFPANLLLSIWLNVSFDEIGEFGFQLEIKSKTAQHGMDAGVSIGAPNRPFAIYTPRLAVQLSEPEEIQILMGLTGEEKKLLASYPVLYDPSIPSPFASGPEPLSEQLQNDV